MRSIWRGVMLLTMIFFADNAFGCSCGGGGELCQAYGSASAVFVGSAIAVRTAERKPTPDRDKIEWAPRTFKFSVEQAFLGGRRNGCRGGDRHGWRRLWL